jgi:hypothetical protein
MYTPDCFDNPDCAEITAKDFRNYFEGPLDDWLLYYTINKINTSDAYLLIEKHYGPHYAETLLAQHED